MERKLIEKDFIQTMDHVDTWKDAIRIAAKPLLEHQCIQESYIDAMIQTVIDLGSYIVIAPDIAMPHARSEGRVLKNSISILKLEKPVYFDSDEASKATFIMPIACVDNENHLTMLAKVAEILGDPDTMEKILHTNDAEKLYEMFETLTFEEETQ